VNQNVAPALPPQPKPVRDPATAKRRAPRVFAIVLGALVLPLPVFVLVAQSGLVHPAIPASEWQRETVLGAIHAFTGLPAIVVLCLLPFLVAGVAWVMAAGVERLVRAPRIDPHDHAWTSFTWALRSWRGALRWLVIVSLPTLALAAAWVGLSKMEVPVVSEWLRPVEAEQLLGLLWLSLPFFLLDTRNYANDLPPRRWSARWPTRQVWFLFGTGLAALGLLYLLGALDVQPWITAQTETTSGRAILACAVVAVWVLALSLSWVLDLAWLSRADWSGLPAVWRRGLHPRVLATSALQWLRPALYLLPALLPVVVWGWFFVGLLPQAEETLRDHGAELGGFWMPLVHASRWMVAWWWALVVGLIGLASIALECLVRWFGPVAWARLMLELGVVQAAPTATGPTK
jgi:hypothetical protein